MSEEKKSGEVVNMILTGSYGPDLSSSEGTVSVTIQIRATRAEMMLMLLRLSGVLGGFSPPLAPIDPADFEPIVPPPVG